MLEYATNLKEHVNVPHTLVDLLVKQFYAQVQLKMMGVVLRPPLLLLHHLQILVLQFVVEKEHVSL